MAVKMATLTVETLAIHKNTTHVCRLSCTCFSLYMYMRIHEYMYLS